MIELFNYDTGVYDAVDTSASSNTVDLAMTVTVSSNAADFVDSETNRVKARVLYQGTNNRRPFIARLDHIFWKL